MTTLYHGSPFDFDNPDPARGKAFRDFGVGFYLAETENDSLSIAVKDSWDGWLYTYEMNDAVFDAFTVLEFDGYDDAWLECVYNCRMGQQTGYDIIIGPTAGGTVNDIFEDARRNNTPFEAIKGQMEREITDTRWGYQWCIANPDVLSYMTLMDKEHITR